MYLKQNGAQADVAEAAGSEARRSARSEGAASAAAAVDCAVSGMRGARQAGQSGAVQHHVTRMPKVPTAAGQRATTRRRAHMVLLFR